MAGCDLTPLGSGQWAVAVIGGWVLKAPALLGPVTEKRETEHTQKKK